MSNLILCKNPVVSHPYYVQALGVRLYTAEELSYYIYNNLMLIESDFIDDRLLEFIRETGYETLAYKLDKWKDSTDFRELLLVILQDIHYYGSQELEKFREEADRIATEGYEAVAHERADYMLSIGRFYDALHMYDRLLSGRSEYIADKKTCSRIYEGMGCAYARLLSYERAVDCYTAAWKTGGSEKSLKRVYMIHLLCPGVTYDKTLFEGLEPGKLPMWAAELSAAREQAATYGKARDTGLLEGRDSKKRREGYLSLISEWREEYRRSMG